MGNNIDEYLNLHPFIDGIIEFTFGVILIIYSLSNMKYSEKRMKILKEEAKTDKSKYFNLGLIVDVKWHAIISILMGVGLIIYGMVLIIENVF